MGIHGGGISQKVGREAHFAFHLGGPDPSSIP
jgi:hypothetical protein